MGTRQRLDERGFTVVDVSSRSDNYAFQVATPRRVLCRSRNATRTFDIIKRGHVSARISLTIGRRAWELRQGWRND